MKIFIVDQQCIAIEGVANVLRKNGWGNIAGFANNVAEAVLWLQQNETDLIITETRFSDGSVCELIKYVKEKLQQTKILILSGENSVRKVNELFRQGISGFIDKHNNCQEILHAIACIQKSALTLSKRIGRISFKSLILKIPWGYFAWPYNTILFEGVYTSLLFPIRHPGICK